MLDFSELFSLNKKHMIGKILCAQIDHARIAAIEMPQQNAFKNIVVLTAEDFVRDSCVDVMGSSIPIFAWNEVFYRGQPIMAIFGYETEDIELYEKQVKVSYEITQELPQATRVQEPFVWRSGNPESFFKEGVKTISSSFEVSPYSNTIMGAQRTFALYSEGRLYIRTGSQWPLHVRRAVSQSTGIPLDNIVLDNQQYYSPYDQYIVLPSIYASIAAMAAIKTGEVVYISTAMSSYQAHLTFDRITAVSSNGDALSEHVVCNADLGAYPIFTPEICNSLLAGLVPVYPLKAIDVTINILRSNNPPSGFFGDLGYSMALASTESHYNKLAYAMGYQPGAWKSNALTGISFKGPVISESIRESSDFPSLKKMLDKTIADSMFPRKFAANSQKSIMPGLINPFLNYSRGIGISIGEGIMGFSQQFNSDAGFSLAIALTEDGRYLVNTGMQADKSMLSIWKKAICDTVNAKEEDIEFMDVNDRGVIDTGPSVLSRNIGFVPELMIKALKDIERKKAFTGYPVISTASCEADILDPYYFSSCFGSIALELHIDHVSLSPVIDNVWVRFKFGHIFDIKKLKSKARHTVTTTISEICPDLSGSFNINLDISNDDSLPAASGTSAIRGMTIAALLSALSQALGHPVDRIPVTNNDIFEIVQLNQAGIRKTIKSETVTQAETKSVHIPDKPVEKTLEKAPEVEVNTEKRDSEDITGQTGISSDELSPAEQIFTGQMQALKQAEDPDQSPEQVQQQEQEEDETGLIDEIDFFYDAHHGIASDNDQGDRE